MNHVFHRHTLADLPLAASGDGPYIIDTSGKRYIDACGGAAVSCLGHSNARVQQSIHRQIDKIPYAHSSFFSNDGATGAAAACRLLKIGQALRDLRSGQIYYHIPFCMKLIAF